MNKDEQIKILDKICPLACHHSKRRVRHDFFKSIETEIQAYLLGFYTADGWCNSEKGFVRIQLQAIDADVIYLFKDFIAPDARTYNPPEYTYFDKKLNKWYTRTPIFGIDFFSKTLTESLVLKGLGSRKTYRELTIPKMSENLIPHFIRGYFDGDGTISWSILGENTTFPGGIKAGIKITSKTKSLLEEIKTILFKEDILSSISYSKTRDVYTLCISRGQLSKAFSYLYNDSHFYMKRKYEKFSHFVNTEVTQLIAEYRKAQELKASNTNNTPTSAEHPTRVNMCAELTGNCENSEIKSSGDNIIEGSQKF